MKVEFSPLSRADFVEIYHWISADRPDAADRMVIKLQARARHLGRYPYFGSAAPDCGANVRVTTIPPYVIYYQVTDHIRILRVLHGARDHGPLVEEVE
jgi:toxin ParE1/3/4